MAWILVNRTEIYMSIQKNENKILDTGYICLVGFLYEDIIADNSSTEKYVNFDYFSIRKRHS